MITSPRPAIVLVDDEPAVLIALYRSLRHLAPAYDLIAVADGPTALAVIRQQPIALVITDHHMPGMDGTALTVAIKVMVPRCPVVLITGCFTPELVERSCAARTDFYLPKPFGSIQLAALVQAALAQAALGGAVDLSRC